MLAALDQIAACNFLPICIEDGAEVQSSHSLCMYKMLAEVSRLQVSGHCRQSDTNAI